MWLGAVAARRGATLRRARLACGGATAAAAVGCGEAPLRECRLRLCCERRLVPKRGEASVSWHSKAVSITVSIAQCWLSRACTQKEEEDSSHRNASLACFDET